MNISLLASSVAAVYDRRNLSSPTRAILLFLSLAFATAPISLFAQGGDNPTGIAGVFNGNITTGCSYDPYTGNAQRIIPDLTVAGAVGAYPLQWSRIMNSRLQVNQFFGAAGGWKHSYQWSASAPSGTTNPPATVTVDYPDGRSVMFTHSSGTTYTSPVGVADTFQGFVGFGNCYLLRSDGSKVVFYQKVYGSGTYNVYYDAPTQIIDPHGKVTTLNYNAGRLITVTEPAGRWLNIYYNSSGPYVGLIDHVDAGYGTGTLTQIATYSYGTFTSGSNSYNVLSGVSYSDGTAASYTYQNSNMYPYTGTPLILQCNDVRYPGPMKNIRYGFLVFSSAFYGQLSQEKHSSGTPVSTLTVYGSSRTETRGDGPARTFAYGAYLGNTGTYKAYLLKTYTDFAGHTTTLGYDANGHGSSIQDANVPPHTTTFTCLAATGAITKITHPGDSSHIDYTYEDPTTGYYLKTVKDELGNITTYQRDPTTMNITEIDYPDGGIEKFNSFNSYNQVLSHTMVSNGSGSTGGTETFTYDLGNRGLLTKYTPPAGTNNATQYTYDVNDHLSTVTDPGGNLTTLYHDQVGRLTFVEHDDPDLSVVVYTFNPDGTLKNQIVQLNATDLAETDYTYDDYKRLSTVTSPIGNVTNYWYDTLGNAAADLTHTDSNVTRLVLPLPTAKATKTLYDANLRKTSVTVGEGTSDAATTSYTYDPVGNLKTMKDPNGQSSGAVWSYDYDERDRLVGVTDPIATDRNADGYTTSYTYDLASNKKSERRANDQLITYDNYDPMNRLTKMTVPQSATVSAITNYTWTKAGKLATMTDPWTKIYSYAYDSLNRLVTTSYPADSGGVVRTEVRTYDLAGNLHTFKSRAGQVQTFTYDSRNRETNYSWSNGSPQPRSLTYDDASRILTCNTTNTFINFAYFDDDTLKSQEEWGTGSYGDNVHRTNTYGYNEDGLRSSVTYPGALALTYAYTNRNQLQSFTWSGDTGPAVTYTYNKNGMVTNRALLNNTYTNYTYADPVDRVTSMYFSLNGSAASRTYHYDEVGRREDEVRGNGKSNSYSYDFGDQITVLQRDDPFSSASTTTNYALDKSGNRTSVAVVGGSTTTYAAVNNLNQYTTIGGLGVTYGNNGNLSGYDGWTYSYDPMNQLTAAVKTGTSASFYYDGLNRQVARTINGTTTYSVWDGWNLFAEYSGGVQTERWLYAGTDLIRSPGQYYYPDGSGSIAYLTDASGSLLEQYYYDAYGTPTFADASNAPLSGSNHEVDLLFNGQKWYPELGLYDLRNRAYRPDIGRFLQPDPIGFAGDPSNLYRYCGNNPVNFSDPTGEYYREPRWNADGNVTIEIPVDYSGLADSLEARRDYERGVESLSGEYDGVNVNFVVVEPTFGESFYGNRVIFHAGEGPGGYAATDHGWVNNGFYRMTSDVWVGGGRSPAGVIYTAIQGAAHEVLHFLGFTDGYNLQTGDLLPGVDPSDILGDIDPNGALTDEEVRQILYGGGGRGSHGQERNSGNINNGTNGVWGNPAYMAGSLLSQIVPTEMSDAQKRRDEGH